MARRSSPRNVVISPERIIRIDTVKIMDAEAASIRERSREYSGVMLDEMNQSGRE